MARIRIYQLEKVLFLHRFELGLEVLIPDSLSQNHLPLSYRYYDPIICLIQEKLSRERRDYFRIKKQMSMLFDQKLSLRNQLKKTFVAEHTTEKAKYNVIADAQTFQELHPGEIDHYMSKHSMCLQRSDYVSVENDQGKDALIFTAEELKDPHLLARKEAEFINEIEVNFKKTKDVERRQLKGLFLKA